MAHRTKLEKFADLLTFPNVYQNYDPKKPRLVGQNWKVVDLHGKWRENHFGNLNPLWLELACGKGEYTIELARRHPDVNIIGIDIKGNRIWKGARIALDEGLKNVAFFRTRIEQIDLFFASSEIDEIWITFPDPFVKKKKKNRRLTAPVFQQKYEKILMPGGCVHLKTDSELLYEFTLEILDHMESSKVLVSLDDLSRSEDLLPNLDVQTHYEKIHLSDGKKIKYLKWQFRKNEANLEL